MNQMKSKPLCWQELAAIYKKQTGRSAFILPMDVVFDWAEQQTDKFTVIDGSLYQKAPSDQGGAKPNGEPLIGEG